jgi:hypothetical protein
MTQETSMSYQMIPLEKISPSPTNPRKRFDEQQLRELAEHRAKRKAARGNGKAHANGKKGKKAAAADDAPVTSAAWEGQYIGDLGLDRKAIERAYICEKINPKLKAPATVTPFTWEGELWVYAGGCGRGEHSSYDVLPLFTPEQFREFYPDRPLRLHTIHRDNEPAEERRNGYWGVRVLVKGTEYVIGPRSEGRKLTTAGPGDREPVEVEDLEPAGEED